ncbi:MAG: signal peptide peptidase SppA [Phycisphaerae bacterium]|nr:signal peptide peptidase SppA [Phycisphaerae bacterium]
MDTKKSLTIAVIALTLFLFPVLAHAQETPDLEKALKPDTIVHFHLSGQLVETPMEDPFGLTAGQVNSLKDLLTRMGQAKTDDKVAAVILTFDKMSWGSAQPEEIRQAVNELKAAGKPVHIHAEGMTTGSYALLSSASELAVTPESSLWLTGFYGESLFVKGLLDKIGVQADFMHMGVYKSAAEMFTHTEPSPEASENLNWLFDGIYESLVEMIATSRKLPLEETRKLIDNGLYMAQSASEAKLVDEVMYRDEFLEKIRSKYGQNIKINNRYANKQGTAFNPANPFSIFSMLFAGQKRPSGKDSIALVYVEGAIMSGHGQPSLFGQSSGAFSSDIRKALETAGNDDTVKAVILRIDSPGGSAEASEVIYHAAMAVKQKKPLIISMGNVAASGGYYVACGADTIFADKTTITASIGVVGGKLVTTGMWDKLGVNWVGYKRGANADIFNSAQPFTESQRTLLEKYMNDVYTTFKDHVTDGRKDKLKKPIAELAGGRVFTGAQALEYGLVDQIGGLAAATRYAAKKAGITDYDVRVIPRTKDFMTMLLDDMSGQGGKPSDITVDSSLTVRPSARLIQTFSPMFQSIMPVLDQLDPKRTHALYQALDRIELIRQDGIALMMPEDFVIY